MSVFAARTKIAAIASSDEISSFSVSSENIFSNLFHIFISYQTSLDCFKAALIKSANNGCGENGLDFNSGWNCTPINQGWFVISIISGKEPSGETPEKIKSRTNDF